MLYSNMIKLTISIITFLFLMLSGVMLNLFVALFVTFLANSGDIL